MKWNTITYNSKFPGYDDTWDEIIESFRNKDLLGKSAIKVKKYYENFFGNLGWKEVNLGGSNFCLNMEFVKGSHKCAVLFMSGSEVGTDIDADPEGPKIILFYKKNK